MEEIVKNVLEKYPEAPGASEMGVVPNAALTVVTWIESASWKDFSSLLRLAGVADGDAARLITQTADQLNQIARLTETHPELARTAEEAKKLLLRPPLVEGLV